MIAIRSPSLFAFAAEFVEIISTARTHIYAISYIIATRNIASNSYSALTSIIDPPTTILNRIYNFTLIHDRDYSR